MSNLLSFSCDNWIEGKYSSAYLLGVYSIDDNGVCHLLLNFFFTTGEIILITSLLTKKVYNKIYKFKNVDELEKNISTWCDNENYQEVIKNKLLKEIRQKINRLKYT